MDFRKILPDGETTVEDLKMVLRTTKVECQLHLTFDPFIDDIDCDEVFPHIYLGDGFTARNKAYLQNIGITHILNAAEGTRSGYNTNSDFYRDTEFKYLGLNILDLPRANISEHFFTVATFIESAIASKGKVYVHCIQGVSRSATCVIAYLMIKKDMLAKDAIHTIRLIRDIQPNIGFLHQLVELDNNLRRHRL